MSDYVTVRIPIINRTQLQYIFNAEDNLNAAGITFDTAFDAEQKVRIWQLDWSLSGAEVKVVTDIAKKLGTDKPVEASQKATGGSDLSGIKSIFGQGNLSARDVVLSNKLYSGEKNNAQ